MFFLLMLKNHRFSYEYLYVFRGLLQFMLMQCYFFLGHFCLLFALATVQMLKYESQNQKPSSSMTPAVWNDNEYPSSGSYLNSYFNYVFGAFGGSQQKLTAVKVRREMKNAHLRSAKHLSAGSGMRMNEQQRQLGNMCCSWMAFEESYAAVTGGRRLQCVSAFGSFIMLHQSFH